MRRAIAMRIQGTVVATMFVISLGVAVVAGAAGRDYAGPDVGTVARGDGEPSTDTDVWPQFRGANRDGIISAASAEGIYRSWPADGPNVLWSLDDLGEGYSGPAIYGGSVYFHDYDYDKKLWMVRCLSLKDGKEIWRWSYKRVIRRNHGMTRTVPATDGKYVISFDPKCILHCFDAGTGKRLWAKNLPKEYGTRIPPWYNGQCPLMETDRIVIGVGGKKTLMLALDTATGETIWETPNTSKHPMSHASVMPATIGGRKQYLWCTLDGLLGVDAADGALLWEAPWKANVAVAPSPLPVGDGRIFMTSGYKAGSVMIQVTTERDEAGKDAFAANTLYTLSHKQFYSSCQTPVLWEGRLLSVDHAYADRGEAADTETRGRFTSFDLAGKIVWQYDQATFGLGNWVLAGDVVFVMDGDTGTLRLLEPSATGCTELASAPVVGDHEVWAPMAYANGKLILRGLSRMVCVEVGKTTADE